MNLLAIETATETVSVALDINGDIREKYELAPRKHAELLLPWVSELLADAGIGFSELDAIAFSRGPGSFTSLRIGIGIVQGLAWASTCPVVPVSSLAATAQTAVGLGVKSAVVALDARMNEVFTGAFAINGNGIMQPASVERVCAPGELDLAGGDKSHGIGIGFERYPALMQAADGLAAVHADVWPKASSVIALAKDWLKENDAISAELAQPVYLRNNIAQKSKA